MPARLALLERTSIGERMAPQRYVKPTAIDRAFNGLIQWLTRLGVSVYGSRVLAVRGRKSGEWRTVPVNLLTHEGMQYLVAPRGETEWVRNMRAAGGGELRLGRRREPIRAVELSDTEKPPILRLYIEKWWFEVGRFFEGVTKDATLDDLRRIAPGFPVFRVTSGG
jgi:deazaflavin-dependent oxidoreductase (nitroreductase family)